MTTTTTEHLDIEFAPGLLLDVVAPAGDGAALPTIVWLHGGAWAMQDRRARPDFVRHFAERGFVMVSIDYRLTPDTIFPGQLHDVRRALRWLRTRAADFRIDPDRIGVWGSSAGGHLAALAGVHSADLQLPGEDPTDVSSAVRAVVDGYGPADFPAFVPGEPQPNEGASPEARLVGGPIRDNIELARAASPALQVGPGKPPFLIMHGVADNMVPAEQSVRLFDALAAHGNDVTLYLIEGFGHGFLMPGDILELGPGMTLDQGRLDADPGAPAEVRSTRTGRDHAGPSFDTIEAFFADHLNRGPHS